MISLRNLSFGYSKGNVTITNITYDFLEGNLYILQGANGVGKTTLLKLLLGLLKPTSGDIQFPNGLTSSYLPDNNGLYENLTVFQNIKFRLGLYNTRYKDKEEEINQWLQEFELHKIMTKKVGSLSLGTKKKVAIICSCIVPSNFLVLDEPLNGLDKKAREVFLSHLNRMRSPDKIIICVSHDLNIISANRIILKSTCLDWPKESGE